jgi:homoserine kinase type II
MHLAARDFPGSLPNPRGLDWCEAAARRVAPFLDAGQSALLADELAAHRAHAATDTARALPRSAVHADLFRDNVLFDGDRLGGVIDFYFAGVDTWLFDIAVCLNDWCVDLATGACDTARQDAFLQAYARVRPLTAAERRLLPAMQRAGALRFWISRLWDLHLPREASMLKPHDPTHFERVLRQRVTELAPA